MVSDHPIDRDAEDDDAPLLTPGRLRAEAIKRLQIGLSGLGAMVLLVGLANIIMDRARETDKTTVPEAAATQAAEATPAPNKDPLADAGVVPELPSEPVATAAPAARATQGGNGSAAQP